MQPVEKGGDRIPLGKLTSQNEPLNIVSIGTMLRNPQAGSVPTSESTCARGRLHGCHGKSFILLNAICCCAFHCRSWIHTVKAL